MIKKTITYKDFNDVERSEDFYFNLSESEIISMEVSEKGGLSSMLLSISASKEPKQILDIFERILKASYGVKSSDGRLFIKSDEAFKEFKQSNAYNELMIEFFTNVDSAVEFVSTLIPDIDKRFGLSDKKIVNN